MGEIFEQLAKMYKIWKYFEEGKQLRAIIARNKMLQ